MSVKRISISEGKPASFVTKAELFKATCKNVQAYWGVCSSTSKADMLVQTALLNFKLLRAARGEEQVGLLKVTTNIEKNPA